MPNIAPPADKPLIPSGRFAGQPLDVRRRRSLHIVSETDEHYVVDYFFHRSEFRIARIPKRAVTAVIGQRFNFSEGLRIRNPLMNHAQVRFTFDEKNPVKVYERGADVERDEALFQLCDLVYSIEVVGPKGTSWNLLRSFGDFVSAHRLVSLEEVVFERIVLCKYTVIQSPPLLLSAEDRNRGLELCLRRGHSAGLEELYYLVTLRLGAANCTSEAFRLLDSLISKRYSRWQRISSIVLWRLPFNLRRYLILRGAIDPTQTMPTLNEECHEMMDEMARRRRT